MENVRIPGPVGVPAALLRSVRAGLRAAPQAHVVCPCSPPSASLPRSTRMWPVAFTRGGDSAAQNIPRSSDGGDVPAPGTRKCTRSSIMCRRATLAESAQKGGSSEYSDPASHPARTLAGTAMTWSFDGFNTSYSWASTGAIAASTPSVRSPWGLVPDIGTGRAGIHGPSNLFNVELKQKPDGEQRKGPTGKDSPPPSRFFRPTFAVADGVWTRWPHNPGFCTRHAVRKPARWSRDHGSTAHTAVPCVHTRPEDRYQSRLRRVDLRGARGSHPERPFMSGSTSLPLLETSLAHRVVR